MPRQMVAMSVSGAVLGRKAEGHPPTYLRLRSLSDEKLMERLKEGNGDALAVLFDRYSRLVLRVALRILRDHGEAEDLLQNVFLEIYRNAARYDPAKSKVRAWVLQYTYHRSLNRKQYLQLRGFYGAEPAELSPHLEPDGALWHGWTTQESALLVKQGLATLTEAQRRTLEMAYFQGLSMSEIAERSKESPGNVRHHYYRGLSRLRAFVYEKSPSVKSDRASEEVYSAKTQAI